MSSNSSSGPSITPVPTMVSESSSSPSRVWRVMGWLSVFAMFTIAVVTLVARFMARQQQTADENVSMEQEKLFEGGTQSGSKNSSERVHVEGPVPPQSGASSASSSRQRFLQSRKEMSQKGYGAADSAGPV